MKKRIIVSLLSVLVLAACTTGGNENGQGTRSPFDINGVTKRLNTADCQDVDDWYLDGFQVGKNLRNYHQKLFQQRVNYCQQYGEVAEKLKSAWQDGYQKAR